MLRYHGVLAGHAEARSQVVPAPTPLPSPPAQLGLFETDDASRLELPPPARHPWSWLLRRVFAVEVAVCPRCEGSMQIVEIATDQDDISRVLADQGLGPRAPPRPRPARAGQLELAFG